MQVRQITLEGQQNYDSAGGAFPLIYSALVTPTSDPSHSANQLADTVVSAKRWIAENRE